MSNSTSRPGKLLIVDDDVQLLRGAARWLRHEGHETFTATSPEQALPLLARHGVEVVIADHYFEASSPTTGIEFLEHIELHWPGCGRILITGAEQREVLEEAVNVGHVQRILLKPVDRTRLLEAVAEVLALTRLTEENRQLQQENRRQLSALEAAKSDLERMVAQRTMELSQAKREWERTFDAIQEPIAILTPDQEVRRGNLALAAHARVPIQQVVGSRCHRLMFQRKEPCPACPFVVTRQRGEPARGEVRDAKMGSTFQVHTYPVLDGSGALFSIVCWYKDITEQQRLYQRVLHTEKMASLGTLASGVAHEINNPLAGILTWTQILLAECTKDSDLYQSLREIEENTLRCKEIVKNLRYFSRSETPGRRQELRLNEVIANTLRLMQRSLEKQGLRFVVELDPELRPIVANLTEMQSVFSNLVSNAVFAVGNKGTISVRTRNLPNDRLQIEVQDDGVGMDTATMSHIFEPFFTTKTQGEGMGLGLALTFGIVEGHGGSIEVVSAPGQGATFRVILPAGGGKPARPPSSGRNRRHAP